VIMRVERKGWDKTGKKRRGWKGEELGGSGGETPGFASGIKHLITQSCPFSARDS
jgi:hypothetical protein